MILKCFYFQTLVNAHGEDGMEMEMEMDSINLCFKYLLAL
jgi:hypothetical protein